MIRFFIIASALSLLLPASARAGERGLLWRVVQTCIADHRLTGGSFPCLSVNTEAGAERGYAVVRAPFERLHIVVTPTVRTIGIEDPRLVAPDAPNYFADAWASRHFVGDDLVQKPGRADLALAINSAPGRSQDQLHIHVACVRTDVKRALAASAAALRAGRFSPVKIPRGPSFMAMQLEGADLAGHNPFKLVADTLHPAEMGDITIVVVGTGSDTDKPGFVLLARSRLLDRWDNAVGEGLLDEACRAFR